MRFAKPLLIVALLSVKFQALECVQVRADEAAKSKAQSSKPNVVMILSDDQAYGDYSFMGHSHIQTPNLDALAARSLTFTRGYVPDSLCRPSLATIISGLYPHQHGIVGNDPPLPASLRSVGKQPTRFYRHPDYLKVRNEYLEHAKRMTTLPEYLQQLGYRSMQTGKWWEGHFSSGGFDEGMTVGDFSKDGRHGDIGLTIGRETMKPIATFLEARATDQQPFFLWYAPMLPHTPHDPAAALFEKYRKLAPSDAVARYWANCERFDQTCGDLFSMLESHQMSDNTIIVYVCDNGWITNPKTGHYAPRSKRSPNEGGTRTPIMVSWPGHIEPKRDTVHLASSIDLVPTVLGLLGIERPEVLPGINLCDAVEVQQRNSICGEIFEHDIVSMNDPAASLMYRWIIQGSEKLIVPAPSRPGESPQRFDLASDPTEDHDLASENPRRVAYLQSELDRLLAFP